MTDEGGTAKTEAKQSPGLSLSKAQRDMVLKPLRSEKIKLDSGQILSRLEIIEIRKAKTLPAGGMYVVLRGKVQLRQNEVAIATARRGDYFYEEHLELSKLPVSLEAYAESKTKLAYLSKQRWFDIPAEMRKECFATLFGDLVTVHLQDFQQPINCCSVTAAALSMSALGFSCQVNDIFQVCSLPPSYIVNNGISMGELFDVACNYISSLELSEQVQVQAYFMDEAQTSEQMLLDAIDESNRVGGEDDILVANFQVGAAHGSATMPGGHFAIIAKCNPSTGLVHMMDVHPEKYGKLWVTTISRLYAAMTDRDGTSMRSRGVLRFSARAAVNTALETLSQDCVYVDSTRYLSDAADKRRNLFRRASPNLNSLSVLAESFAILGDIAATEEKLLLTTSTSFTKVLSQISTVADLQEIAQKYVAHAVDVPLTSYCETYENRASTQKITPRAWFKERLLTLTEEKNRHLMINIDFNRVLGFEAIYPRKDAFRETALLEEFWCLCTQYDPVTDMVTVVDMSPATSQVWQTTRQNVFRGLRNKSAPALLVIEQAQPAKDPSDILHIIEEHPIVLFHSEDEPDSYMVKSVLMNIGVSTMKAIELSGHTSHDRKMRRQLSAHFGADTPPHLFFKGEYQGSTDDILSQIEDGQLQRDIKEAGLPVLLRERTPSLDKNKYGYPKGGLTERPEGKRNVLLCACGSSAADKVPDIAARLKMLGHNVKFVPSVSAERFFKDISSDAMDTLFDHTDFYRDADEWNFRYTQMNMPLRASHLALCDWADCVIVAPITCNTMGKIANGIADNLLTSIFIAWQYQKKPVIICPACNTNMWNNITTQRNVEQLKSIGIDFVGPDEGILSNGMRGIGMMAKPSAILRALENAFEELDDQDNRIIRWAKEAAASGNHENWQRVFRSIDERVVGIDIVDDENGDTLLHYAAGGEGRLTRNGEFERGVPDLLVAQKLIEDGINVNTKNDFGFTCLHVAVMNDSAPMVQLLLDAENIDAQECVDFIAAEKIDVCEEITEMLAEWVASNGRDPIADTGPKKSRRAKKTEQTFLYFTYGSLKQGFPNHEAQSQALGEFVGTAKTRQPMPLIVPNDPSCDNPNCGFDHRMAVLVDRQGLGHRVSGELYRVTKAGLAALDTLEGFAGPGAPENVYERKKIKVVQGGHTQIAFAYVIKDAAKHLESLKEGTSQTVADYTLEMAQGTPKPGFVPAQ